MRIPCGAISIGLDSPEGDISFLSHAHSDHTAGMRKRKSLLSSPATVDLAGMAAGIVEAPGARLMDAGHILGARQLMVDGDGERIVYTGDISLRTNIFGMKAEMAPCDRLIMEATYGDPSYVFPPLEEVYAAISRWVKGNSGKNMIIGAYELGKSQELVRILNEDGIAPIVTERTDDFCEVYGKHGIKLDRLVVGSDEAEGAMGRSFAAIVPMWKAKRYFAKRLAEAFERPTVCAVATGWALHYRFNTDAAFALSDHADFNDLAAYVEQSGAKEVEFFCGDGSRVLRAAREKNEAILNS
jgi:putative mRNA 3-end processing factor